MGVPPLEENDEPYPDSWIREMDMDAGYMNTMVPGVNEDNVLPPVGVGVDQRFMSKYVLQMYLKDYCIRTHVQFKVLKLGPAVYYVHCTGDQCPWHVYASFTSPGVHQPNNRSSWIGFTNSRAHSTWSIVKSTRTAASAVQSTSSSSTNRRTSTSQQLEYMSALPSRQQKEGKKAAIPVLLIFPSSSSTSSTKGGSRSSSSGDSSTTPEDQLQKAEESLLQRIKKFSTKEAPSNHRGQAIRLSSFHQFIRSSSTRLPAAS
ncbi:hypothetical protein H6P81_003340 [Aristolochia fimbriata]|uniref:Transposase MuDR plant domain-containing protein n=1 Tax=Aristolochia fimbriata TaxID=158543 RepID=A0AAV7FFL4_ARIFI|nr:hypothetical protein H6P81_003340 [Aristolochia fimbriata]